MPVLPQNYIEKIYAGFLGKAIGVRLGAPVEPTVWTDEKIREVFGEISGYVKDFTNFAADDDTNGPIFFIRALEDYGVNSEISAEDIGKTWLNYTCENHGMFWWGGYGISTEHTAYLNLKHGVKAPLSGSTERNGIVCAEQIGGQIFIDSWGLVCPGNPQLAAKYARKAASVSHDGNGIYGGMFIAACISQAFVEQDMQQIIAAGLSVIPQDCEYARMTHAVINAWREKPENFRDGFEFVKANYGYDRYPGICHIIPNSAVIILSLLYGQDDFARSVCIAAMCGWDTDCNAGNVGTITGVAYGLEQIAAAWRKPLNDTIIASSILGSLNIVDIPTFSKYLAALGEAIARKDSPRKFTSVLPNRDIHYDFELPGSTHGFRLSNKKKHALENTNELAYRGTRCLKATLTDLFRGEAARIYFKPWYRAEDFDDDRYYPAFSPTVYPGQTVSMQVYLKQDGSSGDLFGALYVRNSHRKAIIKGETSKLAVNGWRECSFTIPDLQGGAIDEIGLHVEWFEKARFHGRIYLDEVVVSGKACYTIDFAQESPEFHGVSQFTFHGGSWTIENGEMSVISPTGSESYTGHYFMQDYLFQAVVIPKFGLSHNINVRVKGAMMGYAAGFNGEGKITLYKNDHGCRELMHAEYPWKLDNAYRFQAEVRGPLLKISVNEELIFTCHDEENPYLHGQYGFSQFQGGHTHFRDVSVKELS